ncbi:MAG: 50S ribosomal protein L9 [Candidatus Gracilibacteria bacterium]|nr:50S ribosomal protein L9 [Candidatus Gracilibacteria bacterium]
MKVLFLQLVPNVGHIGDVKEVSDSYASNFLIPKGLAKKLTPQEEKELKEKQKKQEAQRRELAENKFEIIEKLNQKTLIFPSKKQENGKIFGSVGEKEVIKKINDDFKVKLEKKHIDMGEDGHLKKVGKKDIFIKLSPKAMAKITIIIE